MKIDMDLLREAIWQGVQIKYARNVCDWDALEYVVVKGLEDWSQEELIIEANRLEVSLDELDEEGEWR
ncbi:MAG: hypothetical protein COB65_06360 [Thalassobium sp.]|nr:MAG: hypothetical protein COB65_06360 [Thalassobium sp.]